MAKEDDLLQDELAVALGKKPGQKKPNAQAAQLGLDTGFKRFPDIAEQPAQSLGTPALSQSFENIESRALAQTKDPLPSTIQGPPQITDSQIAQVQGERQKDVFGAFDTQGNRIQSKANQRNQASFGAAGGSQTPDASGTGAQSTSRPNNPVSELAKFRETFGQPSGPTTGVAVARNSYAEERNARLNDPRRNFINDLNRQVRRGQISARAAGGIAANIMGQQADLQLGGQKLAAAERTEKGRTALERAKIGSAEAIAGAKLKEGSLQAGLDRQSAEAVAQSKSATEAAKLGLNVEKFSETQRSNVADEALRSAKMKQQLGVSAAEFSQRERLAMQRDQTDRQGNILKIYSDMGEGKLSPEEGRQLLLQFAPDMFKE